MTRSTSGAGLGRGRPREEERVVLNVVVSMSSYNPTKYNTVRKRGSNHNLGKSPWRTGVFTVLGFAWIERTAQISRVSDPDPGGQKLPTKV
jgi:hypothetical protein